MFLSQEGEKRLPHERNSLDAAAGGKKLLEACLIDYALQKVLVGRE